MPLLGQNLRVHEARVTFRAVQQAPKASFASRLFGYDVFISFALGSPPRGSQSYASDLARRLREHDLTVFFSEDELPPGEPLSDTLKGALQRSKLLVVIVNRGTLALPNWVRTEVETFRTQRPRRPIVPVSLDDCFCDKALSDAAHAWLGHGESVWLEENPDSAAQGLATDTLVARLLTAPQRLKANRLWHLAMAGVALGLTGLVVAAWLAVAAMRDRDRIAVLEAGSLSRKLALHSDAALVRDPTLALLLAVQSHAIASTSTADGSLIRALAALPLTHMQQHAAAFETMALSPSGDRMILADSLSALFQGEPGSPALKTLAPPVKVFNLYTAIKALAYAPDGRTWAQAGSSRRITVHRPAGDVSFPDGDKIGESTPSFIFGLAFSPDGSTLAAVSSSRSLRLHDLAGGPARLLLSAPVDLTAVTFSPDGRWLAVGGDQGMLQALPVAAGASAPRLQANANGTVSALAFDATGQRLFAASRGGRIEVFDAKSGQRISQQDVNEQGAIETMAVSRDGRFIATGHGNGAVLLWNWQAARPWPYQTVLRHAGAVRGLAFAADDRSLITIGQDGRLFTTLPLDHGRWQLHEGPPPDGLIAAYPPPDIFALPATPASAASDARGVHSPDSRWIAWPGTSAPPQPFKLDLNGRPSLELPRLTVVDARTRQVLVDGAELPAAMGETIAAGPAFSADGSRLAVQVDQRLLFWDLPAAEPLDTSVQLPPGAKFLGAAPAGKTWIAADAKAAAHYTFDADPTHLARIACTLAGRRLTAEEWQRYVGRERTYAPACGPE